MAREVFSSIIAKAKIAIPMLVVAIVCLTNETAWQIFVFIPAIICFVEVVMQIFRPVLREKLGPITWRARFYCLLYIPVIALGFHAMRWLRIQPNGVLFIALIAVAVMACDIGAQIFGKRAAARAKQTGIPADPFFPKLSPNKTLDGAIGGYFSGLILTVITAVVWPDGDSISKGIMIQSLAIAVVAPALGITGDLVESKVKRELGVKDMSKWLGKHHGGWCDRFDAIFFAFAVCGAAMWIW